MTPGGRRAPVPWCPRAVDDGWAVFASYAGLDVNPAWHHNLRAHPQTSIEVGTDTVEVVARELTPEERAPLWEEQKRRYPGFAAYEKRTDRVIPVVLLTRR